jgi:hypothetical protein
LAGAKVMSAEAMAFDFTMATRYFITAREFGPSQVSDSMVRAAEAVLCEVRVVAAEINEKLVLSVHLGRAEYLQGK